MMNFTDSSTKLHIEFQDEIDLHHNSSIVIDRRITINIPKEQGDNSSPEELGNIIENENNKHY